MNNCDAQEHGTVTDHDNDDPVVPNRRVLRDGEVGTQTTRNSNGQLVPYGFEDGYPITLSDLVDPGPGGLSDEVSPSLQRSIAAALTDLMANPAYANVRHQVNVITASGDMWEFAVLNDNYYEYAAVPVRTIRE